MTEVSNATIVDTKLGLAHTDHGILSFYIHLDYGGSQQGFGGWCLDTNNPENKPGINKYRLPTNLASELLLGIDAVFGCDWEGLKGKSCRVFRDHSKAIALGHFLEDKWLWIESENFVVSTFLEIKP